MDTSIFIYKYSQNMLFELPWPVRVFFSQEHFSNHYVIPITASLNLQCQPPYIAQISVCHMMPASILGIDLVCGVYISFIHRL
jgi:hypothetical protein